MFAALRYAYSKVMTKEQRYYIRIARGTTLRCPCKGSGVSRFNTERDRALHACDTLATVVRECKCFVRCVFATTILPQDNRSTKNMMRKNYNNSLIMFGNKILVQE